MQNNEWEGILTFGRDVMEEAGTSTAFLQLHPCQTVLPLALGLVLHSSNLLRIIPAATVVRGVQRRAVLNRPSVGP